MKNDRGSKPRGKPSKGASVPRRPRRTDEASGFRAGPRPAPRRDFGAATDPFRQAKRPPRSAGAGGAGEAREGGRPYGPATQRGGYGNRPVRGFTVTLDPDVARVFRGDAAVNRALRLVLQLLQVVQGPPRPTERAQRGYQGSPQARGFTRRPRFEDDDGSPGDSGE